MHDATLLQALLDHPGLAPRERQAFASMAARRADGRALSFGQRAWAQDVGARLGLAGVGAVGYVAPSAFEVGKPLVRGDASARKVEAQARALSEELRAWGRGAQPWACLAGSREVCDEANGLGGASLRLLHSRG